MPSTSQDEIYEFLKKHRGVKFKIKHLVKILNYNENTLKNIINKMKNNKAVYKGFKREYVQQIAKNGREFLCYVYFVK